MHVLIEEMVEGAATPQGSLKARPGTVVLCVARARETFNNISVDELRRANIHFEDLRPKILDRSCCYWFVWLDGIDTGVFVGVMFRMSLSIRRKGIYC